jgi:predicted kinase
MLKENKMNKCYQLVGVPGSGKSTWIKSQAWAKDLPVVSTDHFVEAEAKRQGKTYSEVFEAYMPIAVKLMVNQALICQANHLDFIWDQTSTTVKTRARKFNTLLPSQYEHIAVVFKVPEPAELSRRLASRPGKVIPPDVMESMIKNFEVPSMDEGFKEIWVVGE